MLLVMKTFSFDITVHKTNTCGKCGHNCTEAHTLPSSSVFLFHVVHYVTIGLYSFPIAPDTCDRSEESQHLTSVPEQGQNRSSTG